jgi:hypothetical protein
LAEALERIEALEDCVDDLQEENERLREQQTHDCPVEIRSDEENPKLEDIWIAGLPIGQAVASLPGGYEFEAILDEFDELQEHVHEDVHEEIESERQQRSQADAVLERKLATVAEATDADVDAIEEAAMEMDKITRLVKIGPDDVADRVYPVHERAQVLLENLPDWGTKLNDKFGKRLQITAPTAAEKIGLVRDEGVSSEQVKRVFEKVQELAEDSPREITVEKNGEDVLVLRVQFQEGR